MIFLYLLSGPFPWGENLWSFAVAVTCMELWLRRSLTVLSVLYVLRWISLLVLPPFRIVLLMYILVAFTFRSTPLTHFLLSLCLWFGCVVLSAFVLISITSYRCSATVARNYIFSLIWRCYSPKRDVLDYWGTILYWLLSY